MDQLRWNTCQLLSTVSTTSSLLCLVSLHPTLSQTFLVRTSLTRLLELLSEQQLSALLPPSLRYILTVATQRSPRYLLRVLNSFDEVYALLMLLVERHYLQSYGGSFTEHFYGLKRERVLHIKGGEAPRTQIGVPDVLREVQQLGQADVWKNLAVIVGLPYVKRKLDESFETHGALRSPIFQVGPNYRGADLPANATLSQRIFHSYKWLLKRIYPSVNAAYHLSLLAFYFAYLFDNTKYSSPFLWILGIRMRRLNQADYRAMALAVHAPPNSKSRGVTRAGPAFNSLNPATVMSTLVPRALSTLKILLPASIFALKFLEWWHASDFARQLSKKAAEGLDLPPPSVSGLPSSKSRLPSPSTRGIDETLSDSLPSSGGNTVALSASSHVAPFSIQSDLKVAHAPANTTKLMDATALTPVSSTSNLPIHTIPSASASTSGLCPLCKHPIQTATSAQTGYMFCYTCIFRWVDGSHEDQIAFMQGEERPREWNDDTGADDLHEDPDREGAKPRSRDGRWESGKGRCPITGRRVLGGTDGLRRVMV